MVTSLSAFSNIREIVDLPAPEGDDRTIRRPRRCRFGCSSDEASMTVLASGRAWPSSGGLMRCTRFPLEMVRRSTYCAVQHNFKGTISMTDETKVPAETAAQAPAKIAEAVADTTVKVVK